jgi:two-component sensor histidine kinase
MLAEVPPMTAHDAEFPHRPRLGIEALVEAMREGLALAEVVRNPRGEVIDFHIRRANSAFLRGLGDRSAVGRSWRELRPQAPKAWFEVCGQVLNQQQSETYEYYDESVDRWYEVHLVPVSDDEAALFFIDTTRRKRAEVHQAELFHELNHRVKNNLMIVSAMLSMQARASPNAEVRRELQQAVGRIQTISEVHSTLYRTGAVESVNFDLYLRTLCERLSVSLLDSRVRLEVEAAPVTVGMAEAVQLGIVLNELVTNAAKHAYADAEGGVIRVACRSVDDHLELVVQDFGQGHAEAAGATGLGMRLVRSLVQQLKGELHVEHAPGMTARVVLPPNAAPEDLQQNLI